MVSKVLLSDDFEKNVILHIKSINQNGVMTQSIRVQSIFIDPITNNMYSVK